MNIEQERADFEAACRKHAEESGYDGHERLERNGDGYADPHTQAAWWGWREGLAALQSKDREGAFCVWHNDPETDNSWDTGCRQLFELYDGTPSENRMSFCCYCGKPIQEAIDHARLAEGDGE